MAGRDGGRGGDGAGISVVSDSSPLIGLHRIGRIELLGALTDRVLVPPAVAEELGRATWPGWIVERALTLPVDRRVEEAGLDPGEREAIALAMEIDAWRLVLDDRPARRLAQSVGVRIVGTVGVLLTAKQAGLLPSVGPILDALLETGFRLGPDVVAHALEVAGEGG